MKSSIQNNLIYIKSALPPQVTLVAVSKTHPPEIIMEAYNAGQRVFGENRVQELITKQPLLPPDIEWHLIGHLQTNKVKYIAPFVSVIHSVDSVKLLLEVNKEAHKNNRVIPCLLQMYIATEETKFGFSEEEIIKALNENPPDLFPNISICGVMGMATFSDDDVLVRNEFSYLKSVFDKLKNRFFASSSYFKEISMGMSGDYKIALEEGSTMVRIGSLIFGSGF